MPDTLFQDIKFNCDVSDARYWGYYSICGLLMRYRDLYRSEQGLLPWAPIPREEIAAWIHRKESRWQELEKQDLRGLTVEGKAFGPFDIAGINEALNPKGLVYGAGYGMYLKPTFFLARTRSIAEIEDHTVFTSDDEIARDLFSSPAMLQGRYVFLRLEPLRALLWDKFSEIRPGRSLALEDAFTSYGIKPGSVADEALAAKLERMVLLYSDFLLRHELAESRETAPPWKDILAAAGDRKAEQYLRAVKDLIADTSDSGPLKNIIETKDQGALSLTIALMEGYRRALYPDLREAYTRFLGEKNWDLMEEARKRGHGRFQALRRDIIGLYRGGSGEEFFRGLKAMINVHG